MSGILRAVQVSEPRFNRYTHKESDYGASDGVQSSTKVYQVVPDRQFCVKGVLHRRSFSLP